MRILGKIAIVVALMALTVSSAQAGYLFFQPGIPTEVTAEAGDPVSFDLFYNPESDFDATDELLGWGLKLAYDTNELENLSADIGPASGMDFGSYMKSPGVYIWSVALFAQNIVPNTDMLLGTLSFTATANTVWDGQPDLQILPLPAQDDPTLGISIVDDGIAAYYTVPSIQCGADVGHEGEAPIPEPTTMALLGLGAVGLLGARRRR